MAKKRVQRGLPIPYASQLAVISAAMIAAWLVWSECRRDGVYRDDVYCDDAVVAAPLESLHAMEAYLRREADPISLLLPALDSPDARERQLAAYGLGTIGPAAGSALDKLRGRLTDENALVRASAAIALMRVNSDKESAAGAIAPLLTDSESAVREAVGRALFEVGSSTVKLIIKMLDSDRPATRVEIMRLLRNMHLHNKLGDVGTDIVKALGEVFNDPDPDVRIEAVTAAAEWGIASPEQLRELLQDPTHVKTAFDAIARLDEGAGQFLPDVLAFLDDEAAFAPLPQINSGRPSLESVLHVLTSMKTAARPATERLARIANMRRDCACLEIAETLHTIGADENVVASSLTPLLLDRDPARRCSGAAGRLLVEFSPGEARRQVSLLIPKLGSNETSVDKTVLDALFSLAPQAQEAAPALIPLLQNRDPRVAEHAGYMLGAMGIGSADVVTALVQVVGRNSTPVVQRLVCANALANIGPPAQSIVPELLKIGGETEAIPPLPVPETSAFTEWSVRAAAVNALGRIGGDDERLIPVVRSQLSSRSPEVRVAAADALGRVAGQSAAAIAELIQRLRDNDAGVRAMAALAIGRLAAGRTPAERDGSIASLISALADEHPYVRREAAVSLRKIGAAARAALPVLRELLTDQTSSPAGARDPRPASLCQSWEIRGLDEISVLQAVRAAIEEIELAAGHE